MKCRLLSDGQTRDGVLPAGSEIDHPEAFRLVQCGKAEPADEECRVAAGMTKREIVKAAKAQERMAAGLAAAALAPELVEVDETTRRRKSKP